MTMVLLFSGSTISPLYSAETGRKEGNTCSSSIVISGESNINRFTFTFTAPEGYPARNLYSAGNSGNEEIDIPVREFQPSNPLMYNDFLSHLQAEQYPFIKINFPDLNYRNTPQLYKPEEYRVEISIAGVTREYLINCTLQDCRDNFLISGSKVIKLTDFNLPPPQKLNGLIKVKDEITVGFGIILIFTGENPLITKR